MNQDDFNPHAAMGAVVGALGIKIIEKIFRLNKKRVDETSDIRKEMHREIERLNLKIDTVHAELDHWKTKYYRLSEENALLKVRCQTLENSILHYTPRP